MSFVIKSYLILLISVGWRVVGEIFENYKQGRFTVVLFFQSLQTSDR
jgi:hypothetical protein